MTYKILFNDAVAMTGGQPAEGSNDPARITRQLHAEGVQTIALVSDQPERWRSSRELASGVTVHHRDAMDEVQRRLRTIPGVTAIVYEQTCAAEKRRRRKKTPAAAATRRVVINPRVCEGCGDCSVQSNCISIEPLETVFGRKRSINQSSCNSDLSCVKGFCPSFVEIDGGKLVKPSGVSAQREADLEAGLPSVQVPDIGERSFNVLLAGIGGSGALTVGALLGAAALVDRKVSSVLDFTGLAQKNGAVLSQVRLGLAASSIQASRIGSGEADVLIGTDLVVSAGDDAIARLSSMRSAVVLNEDLTPTAAIVRQRDAELPQERMRARLQSRSRPDGFHAFSASSLTKAVFGESTGSHVLMLGYAWQKGLIPLSMSALELAINNGVAPAMNRRAFLWGRIAAANPQAAAQAMGSLERTLHSPPDDLDELVASYAAELTAYQDAGYARRYVELVDRVRDAEKVLAASDRGRLARTVALNAFKLMAYKDEYEVARLYSAPSFKSGLRSQIDGGRLSVWLAPPLLARHDPATGRPRKIRFGPWVFSAFAVLARMKFLRGTRFDLFGLNPERAAERKLVDDYFAVVDEIAKRLSPRNLETALTLAALPDQVRGYGPVKMKAIAEFDAAKDGLLGKFRAARSIPISSAACG